MKQIIIMKKKKKVKQILRKLKKKIKDKDKSIDILKSLKLILDMKNNKKNLGQNISNEPIQKESLKVENSINKNIENRALNINNILEKKPK